MCSSAEEDVVSMADSTITVEDIEGELFKIERIKDALVRKESELRYIVCKKQVFYLDKDKSNEDRQHEEELLQQIQKLVETRDFLVDDMEFERLRSREEDKEMTDFLQTKIPNRCSMKRHNKDKRMTSRAQQTSSPYVTKTGVTLLKECCGFTCSIM
uniref:Zgc:171844 n=1 Tax=Sinocyclocheilus grahami TaxID=75366 RepID=A0A672RB08_SINGR